jgi:hypothetical protein
MFTDIKNLFLKQHGSFARWLQFETIVVFAIVIVVLTQAFERNYGFVVILLVFAFYVANTYVSIKNDKINDFNSITMVKLQTLQSKMYDHINYKVRLSKTSGQTMSKSDLDELYKRNELDSMYIDANLIHFLFSIIKLYEYNPDLYFSLLKGTNNILRIQKEIDTFYEANQQYPENTTELLQVALDLRSNTVNNLHDFIYTVPKTSQMYSYIGDSTERYATLISRITDTIYQSYQNNIDQRGINTTTKFVSYNTTKSFDPEKNHQVIPGKTNLRNIPFYI